MNYHICTPLRTTLEFSNMAHRLQMRASDIVNLQRHQDVVLVKLIIIIVIQGYLVPQYTN